MKNLAVRHSLTCLLNSLLREWNGYSHVSDENGDRIEIPLNEREAFWIPLERFSALGRHEYTGELFLTRGDEKQPLCFSDFFASLSQHLTRAFKANADEVEVFKDRVIDSVGNIESALTKASDALRALYTSEFDFLAAEQGLVIGHNFHPTPKARGEFSDADLARYSPEFGGQFELEWFMAQSSILHMKTSRAFDGCRWTHELFESDTLASVFVSSLLDKNYVPVPMHPWQAEHLKRDPSIQAYIASDRLIPIGRGQNAWSATSSLRSIYREDAPFMLKFSMSVKLTNSIRHLLPHEVERGLQLQDVLSTKKGQEFLASHPQFHVISEPAYLCFKHDDGRLMTESIVVCRENPFSGGHASNKAVLATLTQDHPYEVGTRGRNLILQLIESMDGGVEAREANARRWFGAFFESAVRPLIVAQAKYGIALGAHQQNLVLDLDNGLPVGAYFRDCQGTGYSELGYSLFGAEVTSLDRGNGNILIAKMGNWLFSYYTILNSTFNVITAIASSGWVTEEQLIAELRSELATILNEGVHDTSCLDYLLTSPQLMHKGNFLCSFTNMNENTNSNPLSIYTPIANPLATGVRS